MEVSGYGNCKNCSQFIIFYIILLLLLLLLFITYLFYAILHHCNLNSTTVVSIRLIYGIYKTLKSVRESLLTL